MDIKQLSKERQAVILLSRLSFSEEQVNGMKLLVQEKLNWFLILEYAIINKVVGLIYFNIKGFQLASYVPRLIYQTLKFYFEGTHQRNYVYLQERDRIRKVMKDHGVHCTPLKGAYLLENMYKKIGSRSINDLDFLIDDRQLEQVNGAMKSLGYIQGSFDLDKKQIIPSSREKTMTWKLKMNNLIPFVKMVDSHFVDSIEIDFSLYLNLNKKPEPVKAMLNDAVEGNLLSHHFLIHLCCHLYKEATGAIWVILDSDLTLIKFCDVREFILTMMDDVSLQKACEFAEQHNLSEALYFTLFYLKKIYNDGYEDIYLKELHVSNDVLNTFGAIDFYEAATWKKTFWERLFSNSNQDELQERESFVKKYNEYSNY